MKEAKLGSLIDFVLIPPRDDHDDELSWWS
jgi:hypothetical protein